MYTIYTYIQHRQVRSNKKNRLANIYVAAVKGLTLLRPTSLNCSLYSFSET